MPPHGKTAPSGGAPAAAPGSAALPPTPAKQAWEEPRLKTDTSDPYCLCQVAARPKENFRTPVMYDDVNPVWNFEGWLRCSDSEDLQFLVIDSDPWGQRGDILGQAIFQSSELVHGEFEGEILMSNTGQPGPVPLSIRVHRCGEDCLNVTIRSAKGLRNADVGESLVDGVEVVRRVVLASATIILAMLTGLAVLYHTGTDNTQFAKIHWAGRWDSHVVFWYEISHAFGSTVVMGFVGWWCNWSDKPYLKAVFACGFLWWCFFLGSVMRYAFFAAGTFAGTCAWPVASLAFVALALMRCSELQKALCQELYASRMWRIFKIGGAVLSCVLLIAFPAFLACYDTETGHAVIGREWAFHAALALMLGDAFFAFMYGIGLAIYLFWVFTKLTSSLPTRAEGMTEVVEKAVKAVRWELATLAVSVLLCVQMAILVALATGLQLGTRHPWFLRAQTMAIFVQCSACFASTMCLSGFQVRSREPERREQMRQRMMRHYQRDSNDEWAGKVEELAGRALTVQALVDFYCELGDVYMADYPKFDPERHLTKDVVRRAVIPGSAGRKGVGDVVTSRSCAYSSKMMNDSITYPLKMVTHTWGALFRDLVAIVVTDALGEREFKPFGQLLDRNPAALKEMLQFSGMSQTRYWICAFSVCQHASICGGNPHGDRDSVSGEVHGICDCGLPKAFNSTEPLHPQKQESISCEINKFSDMMKFVAANDSMFEQVIAVDSSFSIFSRAWCIAELAEAHQMHMRQNLVVPSQADLQEHGDTLRHIRVEDMEATRPADKEMILAGIKDKGAFNASMQALLTGKDGLLDAFNQSLDTLETLKVVGRIARQRRVSELLS